MRVVEETVAARHRRSGTRLACIAAAGAVFFVLMAWVLDRHSLGLEWDTYLFSRGFFAGALLLFVLYGFLLSITARTGLCLLLGAVILAGLFVANSKKIEYLHTTLLPADYYFLKHIDLSGLALFRHYVDGTVVVLAIIAILLTVIALVRYEPSLFRGRTIQRAILLVASAASGWMLLPGGALSEHVYHAQALRMSYSPLESELHAGLVSSLVCAGNADRKALEIVADPGAVAQVISVERKRFPDAVSQVASPATERPDIVVVQSESFFDPAILEGVSTADLLPIFHRAQAEAGAPSMTVPTFGGGTLRTEFEVLTGIPLEAYPDLQFPYLQISKSRISSLATVLAKSGYSTIAVHANSGSFWNRRVAFRSMGFQKFIALKEFPPTAYRDGFYISDHSMTSKVIELLEDAKDPAFVFAISIETHGPYRHGVVKDEAERNALGAPASWPAKAADEFRTYSYHIRHADAEFGRLWAYLKQRKRPFVLVFYGDHLPGFEFVYDAGKFRNGASPEAQRVPLLILGDRQIVAGQTPEHFYSWMVADEVLRRAGIQGPNYLRFVGHVGRILDSQDNAAALQTRVGLQSAARMRLSGTFDTFYRRHAVAN